MFLFFIIFFNLFLHKFSNGALDFFFLLFANLHTSMYFYLLYRIFYVKML